MRRLLLGLVVVLFCVTAVWVTIAAGAKEEGDYWLKIKELSKKDTPQGNPELFEYLKSLTKEQLWTALRQYCKAMEAKPPAERGELYSMSILIFYAEPLKRSDVSDEEFRKMRRGKQRNLEAGLVPARFTKEAFEKVLAGIADQKEGTYFRYTLLYVFGADEFYSVLSKSQKERFLGTCLAVLNDRESPDLVRRKCMDVWNEILSTEYRRTIYADSVVKEWQHKTADELVHWLIDSGVVKFTAKTREKLTPLRQRIQDLRKRLTDLLEDEREPESVKKVAKIRLLWLDRLPLINAKDPAAAKPPKN